MGCYHIIGDTTLKYTCMTCKTWNVFPSFPLYVWPKLQNLHTRNLTESLPLFILQDLETYLSTLHLKCQDHWENDHFFCFVGL